MSNLEYWDRGYANWLFQYVTTALGGNEYGAAGLLGNTYAESRICPYRCEGMNYTQSLNETNNVYKAFTTAHDFARHYTTTYYYEGELYYGYGYSLSQWTTFSRKEAYWTFCGRDKIGDLVKSAQFLIYELQNGYPAVWNVLVNATSIEQASDYVLAHYEIPRILDYEGRRANSRGVYEDFVGTPPVPPPGPIPLTTEQMILLFKRRIDQIYNRY